jgi:hypothetical protein
VTVILYILALGDINDTNLDIFGVRLRIFLLLRYDGRMENFDGR